MKSFSSPEIKPNLAVKPTRLRRAAYLGRYVFNATKEAICLECSRKSKNLI